MKTRLFQLLTLLVLLAGLFPTTAALADGDDGNYEFNGIIQSLPANGWIGDWVVNDGFSNRTVRVDAFTRIEQEHGAVVVNACVEVKGWLQADSSVNATKIETKEPWKCGTGGGGGGGSDIKFYGTIESLPAGGWIGTWVVSGRTVHVSTATRIEQEHGVVAVGAYVEVKGWLQADGSVNATKIEVKMSGGGGGGGGTGYIKFYGTIDSLPAGGWIGDWVVSGRTVHVTAATRIEQEHGAVAVGAYVEVKGWAQTDGSVNATKIEVKSGPGSGGGSGGGSGYTKFYGTVEQMPAGGFVGTWIVSARTVHVSNTTWIDQEHGLAVVGAYVEVHGYLQTDGSVNATKIEVQASPGGSGGGTYTKFYGTIEQMPTGGFVGTWVISGRVTTVTATTWVDQEHGPAMVGAYVEVEGYLQADGSVNATRIEVKSSPGSGGGGGSVGYVKFYGVIEDLPATGWIGDWMVSGRSVHVSNTTRVEQEHGLVRIGAYVEVKGIQQADGSVNATKIEVKN